MIAEQARKIGATIAPAKPARRLTDDASVMIRARLPGGLFEVRFDGPDWGVKQLEKLRMYVDLMLESAIEWEEAPGMLDAAREHDPQPLALAPPLEKS